jgi:hypothetical protein
MATERAQDFLALLPPFGNAADLETEVSDTIGTIHCVTRGLPSVKDAIDLADTVRASIEGYPVVKLNDSRHGAIARGLAYVD